MVISKEDFVSYMNFIEKKQLLQNKFCSVLEELSENCYCDAFIYSDYEEKLVNLLTQIMEDESELITYKLYEFDQFDAAQKAKQLKETPEVETWETVYDYLIENIK